MTKHAVKGVAIIAAIGTILFWGCSKDSPTGGSAVTEDQLIGKWILSTVHTAATETMHISISGMTKDTTIAMDTTAAFHGNNDSVVF